MRSAQRQVPAQLGSIAWRYGYPRSRPHWTSIWRHRRASCEKPAAPKIDSIQASRGRDERLQRLEAVLFVAREPLSSRKLSEYANLADGTEARTLIRRLNTLYDESGRAFRVEEVAGGFQLLSRPKFAGWLRRLSHVPPETRLSTPVLETLAVIAYRQPVLRADIEAIRGVNCGEILRQLMERDLVRISGRSQELGRPYLYSTTKRFLQLFGLSHVDKLPRVQVMRTTSGSPSPAAQSGNDGDADRPQDHTSSKTLLSKKEESEVTVTTRELPQEELLGHTALLPAIAIAAQARDDDEEFEEEVEEEEEDDDFDDDEDEEEEEEDDIDDEEFDEEEFEEEFEEEDEDEEEDDEFDEEDDDDFEDEEWEEVEDEEEEEEEEEEEDWDDDDMDWEDDDEGDEDDEEEEEEEEDWE